MGRKVHPVGFRLKINRTWEGRWYAEGERYRDMLHEDFRIRQWLKKHVPNAGISRVDIARYPPKWWSTFTPHVPASSSGARAIR